MRVTTKGQVTIPLDIRERLNIQPGAEVEFEVEGNVVKLVPTRSGQGRGKRIVERLRGRASIRMSTDEIMALTRGTR
jgi:AbrB family looped-hinge helix DNA binding protein